MCTPISSTKTPAKPQPTLASFSESRADRRSSIAFVEIAGYSGGASSGIRIGSVPGFAVDGLDGFQFFLRKRFVHRRKLFCNEGVEFAGHVIKLFLHRIDARGLIIGWTAFIVQYGSVELRRFLADALLASDGTSFRRCHDLLSHGFHFAGEFLHPLAEGSVSLQLCAAFHERVMYTVDAVDIEAHLPEQAVEAHRRVEFQRAVFRSEFRARIDRQAKLRAVGLFAPRHLHRGGARQKSAVS